MIYKLIEDDNGQYIGSDGKRYTLLEASEYIDTPEGRNVGCVTLDSIHEAMQFFRVTKTEEPNE